MSSKRKVDVTALEIGMYVAELDRPWVESPFLFQGFRIENDEDLGKLRALCQFVIVDDELSAQDTTDRTIRLGVHTSKERDPNERRDVWADLADADRRKTLRAQLEQAAGLRQETRRYLKRVFDDIRLGNSIDTREAKQLVAELADTIAQNPDALLWMTQLKRVHEYTMQHCMNVCVLSLAFACHLGYPKEHIRQIGLGALLHDVGKARTPVAILDKPGRLTAEEFEIMRRHPIDGYELVRASGDVPDTSLEIIKYHHERISGRGYPEGLKGNQIATAVLVVAIADVYDAITSDRIYHHGIPSHEGLTAMYQLAPSDFGKELMTEFIRCIGIYPVGSLVELTTGALGIVLTNDPSNRLRPIVMLVRDPRGNFYMPRRYVSLAAQSGPNKWSVTRIVDPKQYGIDFQAILAEEIGVGGTSQVVHI